MSMLLARRVRWRSPALGSIPFVAVLAVWLALPHLVEYPAYMLPTPLEVIQRFVDMLGDGSLLHNLAASLSRLASGLAIGGGLALLLGIAIALNRYAADTLRPALTFLQSIAGIAWMPLAIIWFGIGGRSVVFVIANTIFFSLLNNTVVGIQQIPNVLYRAARSHGARGLNILFSLLLPGALIQITLGMRTALAYGWRALVAGEMIGGTDGLGYSITEAVQFFQTDVIIVGMLVIGLLWLLMDRLIFHTIESLTVVRWGLLKRH